jgi:hypothetical protein
VLRPLSAFMLCAAVALLTACGPSQAEKEQILRVMQVRAQAMNARNINLYMTVISPAYSDRGKDRTRLQEGLEAGFKVYDSLNYQADAQKITIKGRQAEMTGTYRMKVVIRGREMVLDGKEHLLLSKEADGWKVIAGL